MKKTAKIFAAILTVIMTVSILCGCGNDKLPRERGRYSYWVSLPSSNAATLKSFDELLMYQELQKLTNTKIDFIHPVSGTAGSEAFQILLSSNDIPDIVEYTWTAYPGGPQKAIENGVIISLNKYMQESAPNYYSYMEGEKSKDNPLYSVQSKTLEGNYYGFRNLNIGTYRCFSGFYIRKDLLDEWGLEVPVTIDDWTNVFKVAKENGVEKPLTGSSSIFALNNTNTFNSAWNVSKDFYIDADGKTVKFALEDEGYKNYIDQMAKWFKAGYIDPDYLTVDTETLQGNMTSGKSIATFGAVGGGMGKIFAAMVTRDENFNLVACPTPVLNVGDTSWFVSGIQSESADPTIAISVMCGAKDEERYKEAMKFCDYLYSDEGIILKSFGVEGKTFKKVETEVDVKAAPSDGHLVDSDGYAINLDGSRVKETVTKYEYLINDPEVYKEFNAQSVEAALYHFFRPANSPGFNQHNDYLDGFYPYQQQKDALVIWNQFSDEARKHILPASIQYTQEETDEMNKLTASGCTSNLDAAISDIIMGKKSISEFDSVVETAKKEGYSRLLEIRQTAYNRYLKDINK